MAISKERLWKLINDGSCIYTIEYGKVELHDLLKEDVYFDDEEDYLDIKDGFGFLDRFGLQEIFETKKEAEWHKDFGRIIRTQKLVLPKWEELKKDAKKFKSFGTYIICEFDAYELAVFVDNNLQKYIYVSNHKRLPLTKENYIKSCQMAKSLFLMGNNYES